MAMQTKLISHGQRVASLYKAALENLKSFYPRRHELRFHAVLMRQRFEENRHITDPVKAKRLVEEGERELFLKMHPQPLKYTNSPGGICYGREVFHPDYMLDMWHPLERAQYPEYFARRHQRKKEYIEDWEKKYGKVTDTAH